MPTISIRNIYDREPEQEECQCVSCLSDCYERLTAFSMSQAICIECGKTECAGAIDHRFECSSDRKVMEPRF